MIPIDQIYQNIGSYDHLLGYFETDDILSFRMVSPFWKHFSSLNCVWEPLLKTSCALYKLVETEQHLPEPMYFRFYLKERKIRSTLKISHMYMSNRDGIVRVAEEPLLNEHFRSLRRPFGTLHTPIDSFMNQQLMEEFNEDLRQYNFFQIFEFVSSNFCAIVELHRYNDEGTYETLLSKRLSIRFFNESSTQRGPGHPFNFELCDEIDGVRKAITFPDIKMNPEVDDISTRTNDIVLLVWFSKIKMSDQNLDKNEFPTMIFCAARPLDCIHKPDIWPNLSTEATMWFDEISVPVIPSEFRETCFDVQYPNGPDWSFQTHIMFSQIEFEETEEHFLFRGFDSIRFRIGRQRGGGGVHRGGSRLFTFLIRNACWF